MSLREALIKGREMIKKGQSIKAPEKLQTVRLMVRLTQSEVDVLDDERGATPRATFLRNAYLNRQRLKVSQINKTAYADLARSAANLNQIARRANSEERILADEIRKELMAFRSKLLSVNYESDE